MIKEIDCFRIGEGCGFQAAGETEDDVLQQQATSFKNEHGARVRPDLVAERRAPIRDE